MKPLHQWPLSNFFVLFFCTSLVFVVRDSWVLGTACLSSQHVFTRFFCPLTITLFSSFFSSLLYWRFVVHSPLGGLRGMRTAFTHDAKGEIWCELLQRQTGNQSRPDSTCCVTLSSSRHPSACLGRLLNFFISFLFCLSPLLYTYMACLTSEHSLEKKHASFIAPILSHLVLILCPA